MAGLEKSRKSGSLSRVSADVYELHKERLLDPKRGLYENPEDGVKGHHEMMLTSDMCLVY